MSEISIVNARANVMVYDEQQKKWLPSGNSPGMAKVQVYHHTVNNTYRVVGRKINDHTVVINCALSKGLRYHVATERFHQWRDQRQVYGLNFASSAEADEFGTMVQNCLNALAGGESMSPTSDNSEHQRQDEERQQAEEEERQRHEAERLEAEREEQRRQEAERIRAEEEQRRLEDQQRQHSMAPAPPSVPPPSAPAAPAAPPAPAAPKAPAAPPAPRAPPAPNAPPAPRAPPAPGAPPAPRAPGAPPAPRAPGAPGAPGAPAAPRPVAAAPMSLQDQIANAKLKKSATGGGDAAAARPAPKPALSLQDEMRLKLERRKAKAEGGDAVTTTAPAASSNGPVSTDTAPASPSQKPKWKQDLENRNAGTATLPTRGKSASGASKMNGSVDDSSIVEAIEKMKIDLMAAFKTEISALKDEIAELKEQVNSQR